jgi:pimeloyl-ACP methyl ester carboxylesterase
MQPSLVIIAKLFAVSLGFTMTPLASAQTGGDLDIGERMPIEEELTASGPIGPLTGTLTLPSGRRPLPTATPVFLIVPGSGPTDRDGNSPLGIAAAPYRLLAEALAERGYPSVRIDKRGMFGSAGAVSDPNDVTIARYGEDLLAWTSAIRERLPAEDGTRCVIPIGHSEGGLVALAAMGRIPDACGLILIASIGRPLDEVIREQLRANPANAPFLQEAEAALATLRRGERVDAATLSPALRPLLGEEVQGFLIDAMSYDPTELAALVERPMLVVQGTRDLQVSVADARMLADAAPDATLALVPDVNHVLKLVVSDDPSANLATYANPDLPISSEVVDAVTTFVARITKE